MTPDSNGAPGATQRRACIISLTNVVQEPRVLRQIKTLTALGWKVAVIGYARGLPVPPSWEFHEAAVAARPPDTRRIRHLLRQDFPAALRKIAGGYGVKAKSGLLRAKYGALDALGGSSAGIRWPLQKARRYFAETPGMPELRESILANVARCDLVIAHDYFTYFLADDLAKRDGARYAIDCHEYAMEQYNYGTHSDRTVRHQWCYVTRPYIDTLQRHYFHRAAAISTVCDGIANLLARDYGLPKRPAVIRSTPFYEEVPFRPCGERIEIVYHGLVTPTRNLDAAVKTLALCRPEFRLTVRGPVEPGYDSQLRALALQLGVEDRFVLAPPVPFAELIQSASAADIGYFVFENFSPQRQFTAPNKFFEYMMAGLALVVSDVPELARIIRTHNNGLLLEEFSPSRTAEAINQLDRAAIDDMKRRSLSAARELCWEREQQVLIEAYGLT